MRGALCAALLTFATPTVAEVISFEKLKLQWPVACTLGQTCFIEDFVDDAPGPQTRDYACGYRSRDGHKGTDIALTNPDFQTKSIAVLAAADGVVAAIRDEMPDIPFAAADAARLEGRDCGNAVRISHDGGFQTLYCHMKQGSIRVNTGQTVLAGDPLGDIGLSGRSNFTHLHFSVLRSGQTIDPFAPDTAVACGTDQPQMWQTPIAYDPTSIASVGFSDRVPDMADAQSGAARRDTLKSDEPLILYLRVIDAENGDVISFSATGPDGQVLEHSVVLKTPQRNTMRAFGRKAPATGWRAGRYTGSVRLTRGDQVIGTRHTKTTVR